MITAADDFPIHRTPDPVAMPTERQDTYDRYFFNGYSDDGATFFALAMGFYPGLGVVDAAFCMQRDGVQHNVRTSKATEYLDRMDLSVGPIRIEVDTPLRRLRLHVDHDVVQASLEFNARCPVLQEPRFTLNREQRLVLDYTRMTQSGSWNGSIAVEGRASEVEALLGTRDRSWGVRPVGAPKPVLPGADPQFFWLWTPINFPNCAAFYHLNADGDGEPWNQSGAVVPLLTEGGDLVAAADLASNSVTSEVHLGAERRVNSMTILGLQGPGEFKETAEIHLHPTQMFYMSGLGYGHPEWGHGLNHGALAVDYDQIELAAVDGTAPLYRHIQALCEAELRSSDSQETLGHGVGVVEQLFIGPYTPLDLGPEPDPR